MGYAFYRRDGMDRGYSVACKCSKRGCGKDIDRGLSYLCYECTKYFCEKHLRSAYDADDNAVKAECFAGESNQVCEACCKKNESKVEV